MIGFDIHLLFIPYRFNYQVR